MANSSGNAYGLTVLCPIINDYVDDTSYDAVIRDRLERLPLDENSPMAHVPNTYLARFYILNDVFFEGYPAKAEHLKSKYLVFSSNFHGDIDSYLQGMWNNIEQDLTYLFQYCVGFSQVSSSQDFVEYIKRCQIDNALFFNGSNDEPLQEQLKGLYLKQELSRFAYQNQGVDDATLQQRFQAFIDTVKPFDYASPSWRAGASNLEVVDIESTELSQPAEATTQESKRPLAKETADE